MERTYKKVIELQNLASKALGADAEIKKSDVKHYGRMVVDLKVRGRVVDSGPIEWMERFLAGVKYGLARKTETKVSVEPAPAANHNGTTGS